MVAGALEEGPAHVLWRSGSCVGKPDEAIEESVDFIAQVERNGGPDAGRPGLHGAPCGSQRWCRGGRRPSASAASTSSIRPRSCRCTASSARSRREWPARVRCSPRGRARRRRGWARSRSTGAWWTSRSSNGRGGSSSRRRRMVAYEHRATISRNRIRR